MTHFLFHSLMTWQQTELFPNKTVLIMWKISSPRDERTFKQLYNTAVVILPDIYLSSLDRPVKHIISYNLTHVKGRQRVDLKIANGGFKFWCTVHVIISSCYTHTCCQSDLFLGLSRPFSKKLGAEANTMDAIFNSCHWAIVNQY